MRRGYGARWWRQRAVALAWAAWLPMAAHADDAGDDAGAEEVEAVLSCMRDNVPERLRLRAFTLETVEMGEPRAARPMEGRMALRREDGRTQANIRFDRPGDLAGTYYLWRELESRDETFVYLPALNRVRRVVGSGAESGVMDSEFSPRDLQQVRGAFAGGTAEMLGQGEVAERAVWKLRFLPATDESSAYTHVDADIDRALCVTLAADFVDSKGVVKRFSADPDTLVKDQSVAYAGSVRMHNLRNGRTSMATLSELEVPDTLPQRLFSPQAFYYGN